MAFVVPAESARAAEPTKRALHHRNHEELFPNHQSALKVTDPELIEIFDNFAFDEVLAETKLDTKTRTMMILDSQAKAHSQGNPNIGNDRAVLTDLITQLLHWVGYPRTLNALKFLNEVAPEPPAETKRS